MQFFPLSSEPSFDDGAGGLRTWAFATASPGREISFRSVTLWQNLYLSLLRFTWCLPRRSLAETGIHPWSNFDFWLHPKSTPHDRNQTEVRPNQAKNVNPTLDLGCIRPVPALSGLKLLPSAIFHRSRPLSANVA